MRLLLCGLDPLRGREGVSLILGPGRLVTGNKGDWGHTAVSHIGIYGIEVSICWVLETGFIYEAEMFL